MMVYKPGDLKKRSREIVKAHKWALSLGAIIGGGGFLFSEIRRLNQLPFDILHYGYLALFIATGALILSWAQSSGRELDLLFDWMDPEYYEPPSSFKETIIIIFLAGCLVALLFAARNPLLFGIIFIFYNLASFFAANYFLKEASLVIAKSKQRLQKETTKAGSQRKNELYLQILATLECYFIKRPQRLRYLLVSIFGFSGLLLAILWQIWPFAFLGLAAYFVFFLIIVVSEIILFRWRSAREEALRSILAELREHLRLKPFE